MLKIGLTGGIGSGKTTVAKRFGSLGVPVIDADEIARDLVTPGQPAYRAIISEFGERALAENKEIDRDYLRRVIFSDARERVKLEGILHPLIRHKINQRIKSLSSPYCIVSIPLLIETGQTDIVDRVLIIDIPKEEQVKRTMARDNSSAEGVEAIINAQIDGLTRRSVADDILDNSGTVEELISKVNALHVQYMKLSGSDIVVEEVEISEDTKGNDKNIEVMPNMPLLEAVENISFTSSTKPDLATEDEIIYELPLNEKVRTLIRIESLFHEIEHHLQGNTVWDSRSAVNTFIALLSIFSRPEIKTDLMKELDRINSVFSKFSAQEGINVSKLEVLRENIVQTAKNLKCMDGQIGQNLKQNEIVMSIRQRDSIPGGAMVMDLPIYGHWLGKNVGSRSQDIRDWLSEFDLARNAVYLILKLIRDCGISTDVIARAGFYQHSLDTGIINQIVRVVLPRGSYYFPEISGGRHRFTVRLLKPSGTDRPVQIDQDTPFKLICCAL